ncbi:hypothetical protein QYM36_005521 [Artemia franciscana]|uniref:PiggyBac transposable element-derived protein domain-containing protein n=1 Tax=Artemia franciscana TaxID=6661 RepID=A0AA88L9T9_ARTSF|nr:hypothetical protein QYM36_005521 [Artemia franciscana]
MSSEDDADDRLPNLPFSNAESLSNLLDGELSSSDNESDNQVDRVMEANDEPEKSNDKDSLTLGIIVKKWNKAFEVKDGEPFTKWRLAHRHLNDNLILPRKGSDNYGKLYKIRPLIDKLRSSFRRTCKHTKKQIIDESMVKLKGRIAFKQYMPMKPIKQGYKIWEVISKSKPYVPPEKTLDQSKHSPVQGTSRRSAQCSAKIGPRCTKWQCSVCKVPLCMNYTKNCFSSFHQM